MLWRKCPGWIVSIPAWCDWEDGWQPEYQGIACEFQFQLGAIGSMEQSKYKL